MFPISGGIGEIEREFLLDAIRKRSGADWKVITKRFDAAFKSLERTGFCVAEGTYDRAIAGVGAVLVLQGGSEVYAFSCSAPTFQFTPEQFKNDIGPRLAAMVDAVRGDMIRQTRQF